MPNLRQKLNHSTHAVPTPHRRINRAFDLAIGAIMAIAVSAAVLAPGFADSARVSGDVCALQLSGQPQGCGPAH